MRILETIIISIQISNGRDVEFKYQVWWDAISKHYRFQDGSALLLIAKLHKLNGES